MHWAWRASVNPCDRGPIFEKWVNDGMKECDDIIEPERTVLLKRRKPPREKDRLAVQPLPPEFEHPDRWRCLFAGGWTRDNRIHNKECHAAMLALRRTARSEAAKGTASLSAGDNLSEALAVAKGRGHDYSLN